MHGVLLVGGGQQQRAEGGGLFEGQHDELAARSATGGDKLAHALGCDGSGRCAGEAEEAKEFLRFLLANDVGKLDEIGHALYSAMLNHDGGIVDDLIVYRMNFGYRTVVNCATREKDLNWMADSSVGFDVIIEEKPDLAILAVHGPEAIEKVCSVLPKYADDIQQLSNFKGTDLGDFFVARTGYTGEKGLELIFPDSGATLLWLSLIHI